MLYIASTFRSAKKKSTRAFEGDWCTEYTGIRVLGSWCCSREQSPALDSTR